MRRQNAIRSMPLIVIILVSGGCLKVQEVVPLKDRATTYWELRASEATTAGIGNERVRVYDEFLSSQSRARLSERTFLKQQSLGVENPRIVNVAIDADGKRGTVTVRFDTRMKGILMKGVTVKEDWILENGTWMVIVPESRDPFRRKLL